MYQSPGLKVFSALKQHSKENCQQTLYIKLLLQINQREHTDRGTTYFHSKARGHHIFGPLEVCGVNPYTRLNQQDGFAVWPGGETAAYLKFHRLAFIFL